MSDDYTPTMRAKKAVACLLFVSGKPMHEIEANLTQFGGALRRSCWARAERSRPHERSAPCCGTCCS